MLDSNYIYYIVEVKYLVRVANNEEYYTMSSQMGSLSDHTPKNSGNKALSATNPNQKSIFGTKRNVRFLDFNLELTVFIR